MRLFRLACNCLKYSGPRLAISFPPFRPSLTAAGSFVFGKIQKKLNLPNVLCTSRIALPTGTNIPREPTLSQARNLTALRR